MMSRSSPIVPRNHAHVLFGHFSSSIFVTNVSRSLLFFSLVRVPVFCHCLLTSYHLAAVVIVILAYTFKEMSSWSSRSYFNNKTPPSPKNSLFRVCALPWSPVFTSIERFLPYRFRVCPLLTYRTSRLYSRFYGRSGLAGLKPLRCSPWFANHRSKPIPRSSNEPVILWTGCRNLHSLPECSDCAVQSARVDM